MPTYVAFLRAINLGATRKFPKDAIKAAAEAAGCTDVETYINTGNLRVTTGRRSHRTVEQALEGAFLADRGFEVPTIAFTPAELRGIVADADEFEADVRGARQYVSLLKEAPAKAAADRLGSHAAEGEHVRVRGRAVHMILEQESYQQATLTNDLVERRAGVATNRNIRVLRELAARWC
ncbi:DUF1697 domain-containing protein [Nocardioides sp.]|uniref:DUF1697 domain-containing protein n=1 Tax=Nocardioides sp. TaxID=35761 RepID=UPI00352971B4